MGIVKKQTIPKSAPKDGSKQDKIIANILKRAITNKDKKQGDNQKQSGKKVYKII